MPRTKVSKNSKRNRDAAIREEKIREFDAARDQLLNAFDMKIKQDISDIETEIALMKARIPQKVLAMKIGDLMSLNVSKFSEVQPPTSFTPLYQTDSQSSLQNQSSMLRSVKKSNDEGYLTEDSTNSTMGIGSQVNLSHMRPMASNGRMPGPLSSAKARRPRRSRSACGYPSSAIKPKPSATTSSTASDRMSRQKFRTPVAPKQKAVSADRTPRKQMPGSPTALLRWPKPGEMVISMTGTPVVSHMVPEQYANVNIPIRDGVLSLRPKKLQSLDPSIVHKIDEETLNQIKLLQSNLELIMSYVDKSEKS